MNFFHELFDLKDINIYCKGGSTLGLVVLQHLLTKSPTPEIMREFLELKLIKDWDFTILLEPLQDYKPLITIGETLNFRKIVSSSCSRMSAEIITSPFSVNLIALFP